MKAQPLDTLRIGPSAEELELLLELEGMESGAVNGITPTLERILRAAWIARRFAEWMVRARMEHQAAAQPVADAALGALMARAGQADRKFSEPHNQKTLP